MLQGLQSLQNLQRKVLKTAVAQRVILQAVLKPLLLICSLVLMLASSHAEPLPDLELFAKLPTVSNPKLSPDGRRLAMTIVADGKPILVVQALDPALKDQGIGRISTGGLYIHNYSWANNERLVLAVRDSKSFNGVRRNITRLLAVDWNGKNPVGLKMQPNQWGFYRQLPSILNPLHGDDEHVLAMLDDHEERWANPHVHKVNIYTGKKTIHQRSDLGIQDWYADDEGNVLVAEKFGTARSTAATTYYRSDMNSRWQPLQRIDYFDKDRLLPYRLHESKPQTLIMSNRSQSADNWESVDETDVELFEYDLVNAKVIGPYRNEVLEDSREAVQQQLPDAELEHMSSDRDGQRHVFAAMTDTRPTTYHLYDRNSGQLLQLGREYPALDGVAKAATERLRYDARDGLEIPAFLTLPEGAKRRDLPLIVYPHGGPWSHDSWGFDPWVQYFASRGYAVFQPQFRGSTGLGLAHEEAGYGEWGKAIQDDITDGVQHLIGQGVADPERICIVGVSFGGYAAAMGLVKTPELYRCGISINGVLDLMRHQNDSYQNLYGAINRAINSSDDLTQFSPQHNIDKIRAPLLLIAAKKDTIVNYQHSKQMAKKMRRAGKQVDYLQLKHGEHWHTNEASEINILSAVDEFLQQHLPTEPNRRP